MGYDATPAERNLGCASNGAALIVEREDGDRDHDAGYSISRLVSHNQIGYCGCRQVFVAMTAGEVRSRPRFEFYLWIS
jgi:hypothetical protein